MKLVHILVVSSVLAVAPAAQAAEADDDWKMFGGILSLVQSFVHIAATTDDPLAMQKNFDGLLSGRNPEANRIAGELMGEMMEDMPQQYRGTIHALARDVLTIARRENARATQAAGPESNREATIQARKDLAAMGLRYYDAEQYRDAVRRGDSLAVELFTAGRGIPGSN
ncbi:MAG: hypothetical protein EXR31_04690 [Betaproteobacteria bacterium]|nr:hypothetical protein [Betaproteobacteria bacterium]